MSPTPNPAEIRSTLTVGESLLNPKKALTSGAIVLVPIVKSLEPPKAVSSSAPISKVLTGNSGIILNTFYDKRPAKVGSLVIGGIKRAAVSALPTVTFSAGTAKRIEIQTLAGSATQISIRDFKKSSTVEVSVVSTGGRAIAIGKFRADKNGLFKLPPLTIMSASKSIELRFESGKIKRKVTLRS